MIRLHRYLPRTRAEGPGERFTLWVQGCHNGCPGCSAQALWDEEGGFPLSVEALLEQIRQTPGIEGITLLGGEPMEQAEALSRLAAGVRAMRLSVLTFTGLTLEAIEKRADPHQLALLRNTDLLIDGPYLQTLHDTSRPWVGSKNQRYLFLTDRYSPRDIEESTNRIELRLDKNGVLRLNGMGDFAALEQALKRKTIVRGDEDGTHRV